MVQSQHPFSDHRPPPLDLDQLMARIRAEIDAKKKDASAALISTQTDRLPEPASRAEIDKLLALPDAKFVRSSFSTVFGREPKDKEFSAYRDRLFAGSLSRIGLLQELLKTEEARRRRARVKGLRQRALMDGLRWGAFARWTMAAAHTVRTIYLLPRRIGQFLRRVDAIERTAGEAALNVNLLHTRLNEIEKAMNKETNATVLSGAAGEAKMTREQ